MVVAVAADLAGLACFQSAKLLHLLQIRGLLTDQFSCGDLNLRVIGGEAALESTKYRLDMFYDRGNPPLHILDPNWFGCKL